MVDEIEAKAPPAIDPDLFYFPFSPEYVEQYILSVYLGAVTKSSLSLSYHNEIIKILESAMTIGFDKSYDSMNYTSAEREVFDKMRKNIYRFSAAKQYQQVRTMSTYINFKGEKSTWPEFRRLADIVFENYNKTYLKTEWITSIGQSQMAKDWTIAEQNKDILPYLTYRTQRDARVRDEHAILDGITLPVDHKFWNTYMPKNGWRCRCFTVSKQRAKVTDLNTLDLSELNNEKKFPKDFRMNPGKDGLIFNPKYHPYFRVAKGDKDLRANNFNLPL
jgi:SPP1 gp7 family putative phage head morphogenesis protein